MINLEKAHNTEEPVQYETPEDQPHLKGVYDCVNLINRIFFEEGKASQQWRVTD